MKILHALVGYLAVTALPFQVLAFASQLAATDYDGYVNITQNHIDGALMKQALETIAETCQTVTSQNHKDSAFMRRVPGDIIDPRQVTDLIPIAGIILIVLADVVFNIVWIATDDKRRAAYTVNSINKISAQYPKFNWVICHSPYSADFDGVEGTDWGYTHNNIHISYGRVIGYDLYWTKSGTFYRYGDGGYINWAYNGNVLYTENDGATVHFGTKS